MTFTTGELIKFKPRLGVLRLKAVNSASLRFMLANYTRLIQCLLLFWLHRATDAGFSACILVGWSEAEPYHMISPHFQGVSPRVASRLLKIIDDPEHWLCLRALLPSLKPIITYYKARNILTTITTSSFVSQLSRRCKVLCDPYTTTAVATMEELKNPLASGQRWPFHAPSASAGKLNVTGNSSCHVCSHTHSQVLDLQH